MNLLKKIFPLKTYKIQMFVVFNDNPVAHFFVTAEGRTKKAASKNAEKNLIIKAGRAVLDKRK